MRSPAYTDRILFYQFPDSTTKSREVTILEYASCPDVTFSDHKPVRARFRLNIRVIDPPRQRDVYAAVVRQLDVIENHALPDVEISEQSFHFSNVRFGQLQSHSFTISNTGKVAVHFRFIPKPGQIDPHPPWLFIDVGAGFVLPGQKATITLTIDVNGSTSQSLTSGQVELDDVLILHLRHGKDYFISVSGEYQRTCLGHALQDLCSMTTPARFTKQVGGSAESMLVPKELWLLVDFLYRHGISRPGLFQTVVSQEEVNNVVDCLDQCAPIPEETHVNSVAKALLLFLNSLSDPIIPFSSYQRCLKNCHSSLLSKQLVMDLHIVHQTAFMYITRFINEILEHRQKSNVVPAVLRM